ncbi:hypothetical protein TNCV_2863681 [Trichonephila clavipes]|nr:hypothetical protein TNCV_2863681 [Trichonephila clavipes]
MIFSRFGLRIAAWNANGVRSRIIELRDFINKHSLDIILIQETHLRPGVSIRVPNYTLYRNDRQTQKHSIRRHCNSCQILSQISPHSNPDSRGGRSYDRSSHPAGRKPITHSFYLHPTHHLTLRVHPRLGENFRT